jgi:hypothetical protein
MLIDEDDVICEWLDDIVEDEPVSWWRVFLLAWVLFI